jgi:capsular polysaccharide biosynthesis protein
VINEDELMSALANAFPNHQLQSIEPAISQSQLSWMDIQRLVYSAAAIVGPHGANLGNIVAARPGTTIIEFGYDGGMKMPSDFFCFARNLGLNYWMSPSLSGDYSTPMTVDVDDIVKALQSVKLRSRRFT